MSKGYKLFLAAPFNAMRNNRPVLMPMLIGLALSAIACTTQTLPPSQTPQSSPTPGTGSYRNDCVELTRNFEVDYPRVNPSNKPLLEKNDLGVGTDSYLNYRFSLVDQNKDNLLDQTELKAYLQSPNITGLGQICKTP